MKLGRTINWNEVFLMVGIAIGIAIAVWVFAVLFTDIGRSEHETESTLELTK